MVGNAGAAPDAGLVSTAARAESAQLGAERAVSAASVVAPGTPFQAGAASVAISAPFHSSFKATGGPSLILKARNTPSAARTAIVARGRIVLIGKSVELKGDWLIAPTEW